MSDKLMSDAEVAWQFFQQTKGSLPGILPANFWEDEDGVGHWPVLTMWDMGSLILAYVSARYIGLIDDTEFERRIAGVVHFIQAADFRFDGLRLVNYRNDTSNGSSVEDGFDSTDTGRLLIALKTLDEFTRKSFGIEEMVAEWDIDRTVLNGKMHDIKNGEMIPAESFLYANYVARGYELWGIKSDPVLNEMFPTRSQQARDAFLREVRQIGAIATEPNVSEAIELGASEPAQVVADVLYDAQMRRYEETGYLTAVSEGPIDRDPWFIYEGYELDDEEGNWSVYLAEADPKWETPEFADENRVLSAKAAFLWFAYRPEAYSELLYDYARDKARSETLGFRAGIYEKSKEALNVFDLNTNASVLESVAFIKNNRRPLITVAAHYLVDAALGGDKKARDALLGNVNGYWSIETRKELQHILAEQGAYRGAIDGVIGPQTKRAIAELLRS